MRYQFHWSYHWFYLKVIPQGMANVCVGSSLRELDNCAIQTYRVLQEFVEIKVSIEKYAIHWKTSLESISYRMYGWKTGKFCSAHSLSIFRPYDCAIEGKSSFWCWLTTTPHTTVLCIRQNCDKQWKTISNNFKEKLLSFFGGNLLLIIVEIPRTQLYACLYDNMLSLSVDNKFQLQINFSDNSDVDVILIEVSNDSIDSWAWS